MDIFKKINSSNNQPEPKKAKAKKKSGKDGKLDLGFRKRDEDQWTPEERKAQREHLRNHGWTRIY